MGTTSERDATKPGGAWWITLASAFLFALQGLVLLLGLFGINLNLGGDSVYAHFLLFFIPSMAVGVLLTRWWSVIRTIAVVGSSFAILAPATELSQRFSGQSRQATWTDVLIDLGAIGAAMLVVALVGAGDERRPAGVRAVAAASAVSTVVLLVTLVATAPAVKRWRLCDDFDVAARGGESTLVLTQGEVATKDQRSSFYCGAIDRDQFSVEVTVSSGDLEQTGPTRIVTSSTGTHIRDFNFHIGQHRDQASLRFRAGSSFIINLYDGVFVDEDDLVTLKLSYDKGRIRYWADGDLLDDIEVGPDALSKWDVDYPLLTGDEHKGRRQFIGTIERAQLSGEIEDDEGP